MAEEIEDMQEVDPQETGSEAPRDEVAEWKANSRKWEAFAKKNKTPV